ncbi:MAG TPA: hypothetical protein VFR67_05250 [Pilimelia sp.]|nr:hypothetical protein [Pilimelia sp.]
MTARSGLDRAALALGAASVVSIVFWPVNGRYEFIRMDGWSAAVAVALGVLAMLAGRTGSGALATVTGGGFVAAAVIQLVMWATGTNPLGGNGGTFSWWLGLGVGLLAVGLAPRIWPDDQIVGGNPWS